MSPTHDRHVALPDRPARREHVRATLILIAILVLPAAMVTVHLVCGHAGHDYIQFHAAAGLIASGENPYGLVEQARAQRLLRQGRVLDPGDLYERHGALPYFYPPWLALACVPLSALNFQVARSVWIWVGSQSLSLAGYGLGKLSDQAPPPLAVALALTLMPCYYSVQLGQTAPLVLLFLVATWRLLDRGRDWAAGIALAWLTVKPQLTVVVIPAVLILSVRRGRWGVVAGFAVTLAALGLTCTWLFPSWPVEMVLATRRIPIPTAINPSVGVTWLSVLRSVGVSGTPLALGYVSAALPAAALALAAAWDRVRPVPDVMGIGVLAAFFIAPYSLGYDLAVLLFPMLVFLSGLSGRAALWLLAVAAVGPYLNLAAVVRGVPQFTLFWLPAGLAILWYVREFRVRPGRGSTVRFWKRLRHRGGPEQVPGLIPSPVAAPGG